MPKNNKWIPAKYNVTLMNKKIHKVHFKRNLLC